MARRQQFETEADSLAYLPASPEARGPHSGLCHRLFIRRPACRWLWYFLSMAGRLGQGSGPEQ
jgi:hypothetical protein